MRTVLRIPSLPPWSKEKGHPQCRQNVCGSWLLPHSHTPLTHSYTHTPTHVCKLVSTQPQALVHILATPHTHKHTYVHVHLSHTIHINSHAHPHMETHSDSYKLTHSHAHLFLRGHPGGCMAESQGRPGAWEQGWHCRRLCRSRTVNEAGTALSLRPPPAGPACIAALSPAPWAGFPGLAELGPGQMVPLCPPIPSSLGE
jgi:hypothetical protein